MTYPVSSSKSYLTGGQGQESSVFQRPDPAFFGRKIFDGLDKIDHVYLNEYLERLGIPMFCEIDYPKGFDTPNSTYKDLLTTVAAIKKDLIVRRFHVMTYCEYYKGEEGGIPEIPPDKKDLWLILKFKISGAAYGLVKYIDSALDAIQLTESQIMALCRIKWVRGIAC